MLPKDITFDLNKEPKDVCLDRFHQTLGNIFGFLAKNAEKTTSEESDEVWICRELMQLIGKYSPEEILQIFELVIPESTRVILGGFSRLSIF